MERRIEFRTHERLSAEMSSFYGLIYELIPPLGLPLVRVSMNRTEVGTETRFVVDGLLCPPKDHPLCQRLDAEVNSTDWRSGDIPESQRVERIVELPVGLGDGQIELGMQLVEEYLERIGAGS